MGTRITTALEQKLDERYGTGSGQIFCNEFEQWKRSGSHFLFGHDGPYRKPKVLGLPMLLHVHLTPSIENKAAHDLWMKRWTLKRPASHRTSDHVLVYVMDDYGDFLLIAILDEPGAHAIADMRTPENKATMERFASIAEAFVQNGFVIA